jgi:hypothetical protein
LAKNSQKVLLGENHRRVVSAVLRRVETTCDEVIWWLGRSAGDLHQIKEDVTSTQADALRSVVDQLREEIRNVQEEISVDASTESRARGIAASVSLTRTELEEVLTPGLRGYGALAPETEAALDQQFSRLLFYLYALGEITERGRSQGAP